MKRIILFALIAVASLQSFAQVKPCEELKAEIAKKIEANGVKAYSLEIVDMNADEQSKKVVGTCDGQTKKILYTRR